MKITKVIDNILKSFTCKEKKLIKQMLNENRTLFKELSKK